MAGGELTGTIAPDDPFGMLDTVAYYAGTQPNKLAIHDLGSGRKLSYRDFDRRIDRCAALLESLLGEPEGQRVAVFGRNSAEFFTIHFACVRLGAIFVPLNWRLSAPELSVLVQDCTPALLFLDEEFQPVARAFTGGHSIKRLLSLDPDAFDALLAAAPDRPTWPRPARADRPSTLLYTSGTTGRPKGVAVTERNLFASTLNFSLGTRLTATSVMMCDMPMFHVAGLGAGARRGTSACRTSSRWWPSGACPG